MKKLLLLLFVFSYHFIQAAEAEPCPPGKVRHKGKCVFPDREERCPPGKIFQQVPGVDYPKGNCVAPPSVNEADSANVNCRYIEMRIIASHQRIIPSNPNTTSNPNIRFYRNACRDCNNVDVRCNAKVRCYPPRVGGQFGVNPPSYEQSVTCPAINGECPEDPKKCMENNTIIILPSTPSSVNPGVRFLRSRESRPQSGGVR